MVNFRVLNVEVDELYKGTKIEKEANKIFKLTKKYLSRHVDGLRQTDGSTRPATLDDLFKDMEGKKGIILPSIVLFRANLDGKVSKAVYAHQVYWIETADEKSFINELENGHSLYLNVAEIWNAAGARVVKIVENDLNEGNDKGSISSELMKKFIKEVYSLDGPHGRVIGVIPLTLAEYHQRLSANRKKRRRIKSN